MGVVGHERHFGKTGKKTRVVMVPSTLSSMLLRVIVMVQLLVTTIGPNMKQKRENIPYISRVLLRNQMLSVVSKRKWDDSLTQFAEVTCRAIGPQQFD
jgi:hypothetical protein